MLSYQGLSLLCEMPNKNFHANDLKNKVNRHVRACRMCQACKRNKKNETWQITGKEVK